MKSKKNSRSKTIISDRLRKARNDHEPPAATSDRGWRYHHLGIPTSVPHKGEFFLKQFGLHVSGFDRSPYGIEWMRFEPDSPISELVRTIPHLAFEVDNLEESLQGKEVLTPPNSPSKGVRVAMIIHDGAPIELVEFRKRKR